MNIHTLIAISVMEIAIPGPPLGNYTSSSTKSIWVAWDAWHDVVPIGYGLGCAHQSLSIAVGAAVRQSLMFPPYESNKFGRRRKEKLLARFPLEKANSKDYLAELGHFCLQEGHTLGIEIRELHVRGAQWVAESIN
jgi:hypothetical protein